MGAAAITPGTDPTVTLDDRLPSVLIFVSLLESPKLEALGKDFGVEGLHLATPDELGNRSLYPLGIHGDAGRLHWNPPRPGDRILRLGLPMVAFAVVGLSDDLVNLASHHCKRESHGCQL